MVTILINFWDFLMITLFNNILFSKSTTLAQYFDKNKTRKYYLVGVTYFKKLMVHFRRSWMIALFNDYILKKHNFSTVFWHKENLEILKILAKREVGQKDNVFLIASKLDEYFFKKLHIRREHFFAIKNCALMVRTSFTALRIVMCKKQKTRKFTG